MRNPTEADERIAGNPQAPLSRRAGLALLLGESFLALLVALAIGHDDWVGVLIEFGWGALLFGGAMTVAFLLLLVWFVLTRRKRLGKRKASTQRTTRRGLWWGELGTIAAFAVIYATDGPRGLAFIAGYAPGLAVGAAVFMAIQRLTRPDLNAF
jgi:hypothetical protein